MRNLLALLLLLPASLYAQEFNAFSWKDKAVSFSTVEMKVVDGQTKKTVFNGYKDAYVTIDQSSLGPNAGTVGLKLSGYMEMQYGMINYFDFKIDQKGWATIQYGVEEGNKYASIVITYEEGATKPTFIIVSMTNNLLAKPTKALSFTLKGFE